MACRAASERGGVTGTLVDMLDEGLFRNIFDVQCFDPRRSSRTGVTAATSRCRPRCMQIRIRAAHWSSAWTPCCWVLPKSTSTSTSSVTTGSGGVILGGSGGHADTAAGARLAIVTTRLAAGAGPKIVERVRCLTTPGATIDAIVTEGGIAVNPLRADLRERLAIRRGS